MKFPRWQIHRGYWQNGIRENTMDAFRAAKAENALMVELDIRISKDGIAHIYHDFTLRRYFHIDDPVDTQRSEDLLGLNIPRLSDLLEDDGTPEHLNIEIKDHDGLNWRVCRATYRALTQTEHSKKVMISSFHPLCLFWFRLWQPKTPRALIVKESKWLNSRWLKPVLWLTRPSFLNVHFKLIDDKADRKLLQALELPLMVWTVNDPEKALFYLERGAASIISDQKAPSVK